MRCPDVRSAARRPVETGDINDANVAASFGCLSKARFGNVVRGQVANRNGTVVLNNAVGKLFRLACLFASYRIDVCLWRRMPTMPSYPDPAVVER